MDIVLAAKQLTGADWNLRGDKLEQAEDGSPRVSPPTMEAIQAILTGVAYREKRAAAYPSIGDQLDALMKGGQALTDMQSLCMAVKAKFPKGE